jgi:two-component system, LuxR family, response regulator FixJ
VIKVYIIDDQAAVRDALGEMMNVFGFAVETFESAEAYLSATAKRISSEPSCVVSDVRMPGMDGIELARRCRSSGNDVPIILISGHADVPMAVAGIKAGATDFIEKPIDDASLVAAINRAIVTGIEERRDARRTQETEEKFALLTPRQREVFDLVVDGFTSHAIGGKLGLSTRTVESYRAEIMQKMSAESVAVLVRQAIQLRRTSP